MDRADLGRRYFSRKPRESPYFWALTVWLLVIAAMPVVLALTAHNHPSFGGWDGGLVWMCMAVALLAGLWIRVRRSHLKLYQIIAEARGLDEAGQRRLDEVLTQTYHITSAGLLGAMLAVQTAFFALAKLLGK